MFRWGRGWLVNVVCSLFCLAHFAVHCVGGIGMSNTGDIYCFGQKSRGAVSPLFWDEPIGAYEVMVL